jgi:hypothetical protein
VTPITSLPFTAPPGCVVTVIGEGRWRFDCGDARNRDARATLRGPLLDQGWRDCGEGLATARFTKPGTMLTIAEGSGVPGDGFIVSARFADVDC